MFAPGLLPLHPLTDAPPVSQLPPGWQELKGQCCSEVRSSDNNSEFRTTISKNGIVIFQMYAMNNPKQSKFNIKLATKNLDREQ